MRRKGSAGTIPSRSSISVSRQRTPSSEWRSARSASTATLQPCLWWGQSLVRSKRISRSISKGPAGDQELDRGDQADGVRVPGRQVLLPPDPDRLAWRPRMSRESADIMRLCVIGRRRIEAYSRMVGLDVSQEPLRLARHAQ